VLRRAWSEEDNQKLQALVASGASALRASVALKRSLAKTKMQARHLGTPFPTDSEQKRKLAQVFKLSIDRARSPGHGPDTYE